MTDTVTIHFDDGDKVSLTGSGYALRCATVIAHENLPDARWALEVLTKYGHLVRHAADREVV
jgi:seryl-tRNA synthetase